MTAPPSKMTMLQLAMDSEFREAIKTVMSELKAAGVDVTPEVRPTRPHDAFFFSPSSSSTRSLIPCLCAVRCGTEHPTTDGSTREKVAKDETGHLTSAKKTHVCTGMGIEKRL